MQRDSPANRAQRNKQSAETCTKDGCKSPALLAGIYVKDSIVCQRFHGVVRLVKNGNPSSLHAKPAQLIYFSFFRRQCVALGRDASLEWQIDSVVQWELAQKHSPQTTPEDFGRLGVSSSLDANVCEEITACLQM